MVRPQLRVIRGGRLSPPPPPISFTTTLATQIDAAVTHSAIEAVRALHPDWDEESVYAEARDMRAWGDRDLTLEDVLGMLDMYRATQAH